MPGEFLRKLPLFADLPEQDLERLLAMAETVAVRPGELLMEEGTPGDALYIVISGSFEVTKRTGDRDVMIAGCEAGEVLGEISLLEQTPRTASVRAVRPGRLVKISRDNFLKLLTNSPSATLGVLRTVMLRLRNTEAMLMQHQKMAELGQLAAGLAHELNNPAAAVQRSADQLREALPAWERWSLALDTLGLNASQLARVASLRDENQERVCHRPDLDPLLCADKESELQEWLESQGVERAWELAPSLVYLGWDLAAMRQLGNDFTPQQLTVITQWLAAGSLVYTLLDELGISAGQISETVRAVKQYSFLDRGSVQEVDVRQGLENTLVILRHKLRDGIAVHRSYAPDLPLIEAHGSELNQVWTNIIDNAIDAMQGTGELGLRAHLEDNQVVVEITDNGPGIPLEIQARIFDPFFTTKEPGVGTGLGLHLVQRIVALRHGGRISVTSRPGETTFRVELPVTRTL